MVDRKKSTSDIAILTKHDQRMSQEPRSEWTLTARPAIALTEMTSGIVPYRQGIRDTKPEVQAMWGTLAQAPLTVFSATRNGSDIQETIMVGRGMTAHEVNALLFFAAPYKDFGLDTYDIISDWTNLYTKPEHEKRKRLHAKMPGWSQFDASRELVLGVLERNYQFLDGFQGQDRNDVVVPVLRWRKDAEGNNKIVMEPLDEGLRAALVDALPDQKVEAKRLDSGMGVIYAAAYSPGNTDWMQWTSYELSEAPNRQVVGPTQVLAYAYRQLAKQHADPHKVPADQDIQASYILDALGRYARTGERPKIDIVGDQVDSFFLSRPANPFSRYVSTQPSLGGQYVPVNVGGYSDTINVTQYLLPGAAVADYVPQLKKPISGIDGKISGEILKNVETNTILPKGEEVVIFDAAIHNEIKQKNKKSIFTNPAKVA